MRGFVLLIPFFLVRFGLLGLLNRAAVGRAAHFAPVEGREKPAYIIYQLSNLAIFPCLCFLRIKPEPPWLFYTGLGLYCVGTVLLAVTVANFAAPAQSGINQKGLYRLSRNPMYVAYFVFFGGGVLLTQSVLLLALLLAFGISTHWIILAEERWCVQQFGEEYLAYMKRVRRYI